MMTTTTMTLSTTKTILCIDILCIFTVGISDWVRDSVLPEHGRWLHIFCRAAVWPPWRCRSVRWHAVESSSPDAIQQFQYTGSWLVLSIPKWYSKIQKICIPDSLLTNYCQCHGWSRNALCTKSFTVTVQWSTSQSVNCFVLPLTLAKWLKTHLFN